MVAVPDDDIANAHGDADPAGALNLGTTHLDGVAVTDVFLDCRRQPGRGQFKIDRTGAETPPQPAEAPGEYHDQSRDHDGETLYPAFTGEPSSESREVIAEPMKTGVRPGQQSAGAITGRVVIFLIPIGIIPLR